LKTAHAAPQKIPMTDERRVHKRFIPYLSLIGFLGLVLLAILAPRTVWALWLSVGILGLSLISLLFEVARFKDRLISKVTPKLPETPLRIQPEGPSFQEVLRAVPDPVMIISGFEPNDIAGRWIIFANKAAIERFSGASEGGLLVSSIRNPEIIEAVDQALFSNLGRETAFETSGAQHRFWRAWTSPLPVGEDGLRRLALLVIRDETDTRRIERMRADFLANASHELRTPLASLAGFIETLRGHAKDDLKARDKFLNIMASQADRMGRLISDLLSLSRIEMNEHVPPSGETDLVLAVSDVADAISVLAKEKGVSLKINGPKPGLYLLTADRDQVLQVVQNLTDNALKYAPQGSSIEIDIVLNQTLEQATTAQDKTASKLVLLRPDRKPDEYYSLVRVRDHGPGIRREFLPRLAERFYRVEGQKSGDRLGTGLGLAIVKHIINRHHGGLMVESISAPSETDRDLVGLTKIYERTLPDKVEALPTAPLKTFTTFSAYLPQPRRFRETEGPQALTDTSDWAQAVQQTEDKLA
jgi:two-component system, OmpR family, phosphate regulon sensor histidine kinase PhoR